MKGTIMKKLALALVAATFVWLPISADAAPADGHPAPSFSQHRDIDWD